MNLTVFEERGETLIEQFGLTKAEFARRMGIQRQNVNAVFRSSKLETIRRVADALNVDLMYLLGCTKPIDYDDSPQSSSFEIMAEDIPVGDSVEDRRARQKMIWAFYEQWKEDHPDLCIYNYNLRDDIHIRHISIEETAGHASLSYLSTLAVLQLDEILQHAVLVNETPVKRRTNNQNSFCEMLVMKYNVPGIGRVKLTVGVKRSDMAKIQYCITALEPDIQKQSNLSEAAL